MSSKGMTREASWEMTREASRGMTGEASVGMTEDNWGKTLRHLFCNLLE